MKITIIGTGYVGLVTGACLAELGNDVFCLDVDEKKIAMLNSGGIPIHEPGLEEVVARNRAAGRLHFSTDVAASVAHGCLQFIARGTPPDEDASADLQYVLAASDELQTAVRHRGGDVGREMQTAGGAVARHDFFQARLMDRDAAAIEHGDFFLVDVEAENVVTQFGQTGSGHQAYVAGANNRDFHVCLLCSNVF